MTAASAAAEPSSFDKLGISVEDVTNDVAQKLGVKEKSGVVITEVQPGSMAQMAGLSEGAIIKQLNLLRPIYSKTTNYGHFGKNDPDITWEKTDKVAALRKAAGKAASAVAAVTLKKAAALVKGRGCTGELLTTAGSFWITLAED